MSAPGEIQELAPGVHHLSDLVDAELAEKNPGAARLEAAVLAQRAGIVFAPGSLTADEVLALAEAREQLELERAAVLEALFRSLVAALRGDGAEAKDAKDLAKLERALARRI